MEPSEGPWRDLAIVDVELLVSSGVPRSAFELLPADAGSRWPRWRVAHEALRAAGWRVDADNIQPLAFYKNDPDISLLESAHPYAMGPMWEGANAWRAVFTMKPNGGTVDAFVDHECCGGERLSCDPGPPLASGSPWRWRIDGLPGGVRCGRAENPVQAAGAVEVIVIQAGSRDFRRTQTRRPADP